MSGSVYSDSSRDRERWDLLLRPSVFSDFNTITQVKRLDHLFLEDVRDEDKKTQALIRKAAHLMLLSLVT